MTLTIKYYDGTKGVVILACPESDVLDSKIPDSSRKAGLAGMTSILLL